MLAHVEALHEQSLVQVGKQRAVRGDRIMEMIVSAIIGAVMGGAITLFIASAGKLNKECDVYIEGHSAGSKGKGQVIRLGSSC